MHSQNLKLLCLILNLVPLWAFGKTGKTANGCNYEVVNGKYYYNCPEANQTKAAPDPNPEAEETPEKSQSQGQVHSQEISPGPTVISPSLPQGSGNVPVLNAQTRDRRYDEPDHERDHPESHFGKMVYAGASLGMTNFVKTDTLNNPVTAYGIQLGTNISEFVGFELGYSYAKTDLKLGLEQRSGGIVVTPQTRRARLAGADPTTTIPSSVDSTLTAHIINAETQFHLTRAESTFRPFAGVGLAYKTASLKENFPDGTTGIADSSVTQNTFGGTAAVGAKLRLAKSLQVAGAFRFFLPISTGSPQWNTPANSPQQQLNSPIGTENNQPGNNAPPQNFFQSNDTKLTSSPLSQLVATVQYVF